MSVAYWAGYPKSWTRGRNRAVQYIVVHCTVGSEGPNSAESGHAYDVVRLDGTSTHVFVDSNSVAREVPDGDRAHHARFHGNEVGLGMELCGTIQTRAQWLDPISLATLRLAAKMAAEWCQIHGIPVRRLSVAETRAAYFAAPGARPKGFVGHVDVTAAYPEDGGSHYDPGPEFPWDVFLDLVRQELVPPTPPQEADVEYLIEVTADGVERLVAVTGTHWFWVKDASKCLAVFNKAFPTTKVTTAQLLAGFGVDVERTLAEPLTQEELAAIEQAAREGAESGSTLTAEDVRTVVDEELDEAFRGGADSGT